MRMLRPRRVAADVRSAASAGPPVDREAQAGISLCQRTYSESSKFCFTATRTACSRRVCSLARSAVAVEADLDVADCEPPPPQPAAKSATVKQTIERVVLML